MTRELIQLLQQVGFPIFVALWFMFRLERRLDRTNALLHQLMQANVLLAKTLDDSNKLTEETGRLLTAKFNEEPPASAAGGKEPR